MRKWKVVRDLQGGSFGMDRVYTADEWLSQGRDWCWHDDNDEMDNYLEEIQNHRDEWADEDIIETIALYWELEMAEVKDIKVNYIEVKEDIKVEIK